MPKLNIFVACPYSIFPMDDYKKTFGSVSKELDVTFTFADERITNKSILDKVTGYIRSADLSLYDITGWNANVSLELGIAIGLGRKYFILLNTANNNESVPTDIVGFDRLQYKSNTELQARLLLLLRQELPSGSDKSDKAFDMVKNRILKKLTERPGLGSADLSTALEEDKFLVRSVVASMVQAKEIKTAGQRRGMKYYPLDFDLRSRR